MTRQEAIKTAKATMMFSGELSKPEQKALQILIKEPKIDEKKVRKLIKGNWMPFVQGELSPDMKHYKKDVEILAKAIKDGDIYD